MATTRKKPGPKTNKGKDPIRTLRVPDMEWEQWATVAETQGLTRSRWMRDVLNKAAKRLGF